MYKPTTAVWKPPVSLFFKLSLIATAVAGVGLTTGCSSTPSNSKVQKTQVGMLDANSLDSLEDLLSATDMRAVEGDRLLILKHGDVWKRMTVGFKMDENKWDPRIEAQRGWFITRQPYIERLSARASRYLYHTVKEAERRGLPTELALLPVIESSYDPAATSSAAAAGMWQFIPSTGKIYGLRQTQMYDGRRDVVESTRAAYEFLGSLYNQFGSWELALAAYNAGPGRIQQAINRNRAAGLPTDYWSLRLPQETMNYVPRFMAVAQIIKSPHQYGVNLPPIANRPHFREVSVAAGSSLNEIASITGLSRAELYQLNPGHRGDIVDATSTMRILIPADLNPNIDARLKNLKSTSGSNGYWAGGNTSSSSNQTNVSTTPSSLSTRTSNAPMTASNNTPPVLNSSATQNAGKAGGGQHSSSSTTSTTTIRPAAVTASSQSTSSATQSSATQSSANPLASAPVTVAKTPKGSDALAAFASSALLPSAPRIPVAVTPAANVKPVLVEPPISALERDKLLAGVPAETNLTAQQTVEKLIEPEPTQAEKDEVVQEITALAPKGTEIVDPLDGKIKLTAIQTSQSIAAEQGSELKVGFAYPKSVAENTAANSDEAQLNQNKTFVKTESEFVVEPPKGKRSTYTVLPGDTLAIIAAKNGINWRDIATWNQVNPNATLFVGTTLYLYDAKPQAQTSSAVDKPTHERDELETKANGSAQNKASENKSAQTKTVDKTSYVVKANDNLSALSHQFNIPVQQLADWNGLTANSTLFVGQKLSLIETASRSVKKSAEQTNPRIKTKVYTVKRGEYLKLIADRFALSNQELASLTPNLKPEIYLIVGQKINVPLDDADRQAEESARPAKTQINSVKVDTDFKTENYKVERGDTLYSIAMKSKMTLSELAELNSISVNKGLMVGQSIQIPAGATTPSTYTVQSGDSLNAVAAKYNLSISQIANLNGLSPSAGLFVGQKLKLSGEPEAKASSSAKSSIKEAAQTSNIAEDTHVVASGETLASIARKYKLQLNYLAELNALSRSAELRVGQRLKIEGDLEVKQTANVNTLRKNTTQDTEAYIVKSGESLNVIASRLGLSAKALADLNGLNARTGLQRGQTLKIPKTIVEYKVKSGDSLIRLASRYGIQSHQLAEMNDLKPNASLRVGDIINVPNE